MAFSNIKRSNDRYLGGVLGGIANYFGWNVWFVRISYSMLSLIGFIVPGLIVYIILWTIMEKPDE